MCVPTKNVQCCLQRNIWHSGRANNEGFFSVSAQRRTKELFWVPPSGMELSHFHRWLPDRGGSRTGTGGGTGTSDSGGAGGRSQEGQLIRSLQWTLSAGIDSKQAISYFTRRFVVGGGGSAVLVLWVIKRRESLGNTPIMMLLLLNDIKSAFSGSLARCLCFCSSSVNS